MILYLNKQMHKIDLINDRFILGLPNIQVYNILCILISLIAVYASI